MIRIVAIWNDPWAPVRERYQAQLADGQWIMLTRERYHRCNQGMHLRGAK